MAKVLLLSKGQVALVDDDVYEWASQHKWSPGGGSRGKPYVTRGVYLPGGKRRTVYLHREIMGAPPGIDVDHRNGDGLDNRRANLRLVSRAQNNQNRHAPATASTGVRNVYWTPRPRLYRVRLTQNNRPVDLGYYRTLEEATRAAEAGRRRLYTHSAEDGGD